MSTNAQRFGEVVKARREALDLNQLDVWQAGGPSNTTLTKIENGLLDSLARVTARRLDAGLRWEPGSAKRVWEGGEPTPVAQRGDEGERGPAWLREQIAAARLDEDTQAKLLNILDERRWGA